MTTCPSLYSLFFTMVTSQSPQGRSGVEDSGRSLPEAGLGFKPHRWTLIPNPRRQDLWLVGDLAGRGTPPSLKIYASLFCERRNWNVPFQEWGGRYEHLTSSVKARLRTTSPKKAFLRIAPYPQAPGGSRSCKPQQVTWGLFALPHPVLQRP